MSSYDNYYRIRDAQNLKDAAVAKATGIARSTFTDWKTGRSEPKTEKLAKIADALNVSVGLLITGEDESPSYFINSETAELAQEIHDRPELTMLFKMLRKASPESLKLTAEVVERIVKAEKD